jgi:hypothetical protein
MDTLTISLGWRDTAEDRARIAAALREIAAIMEAPGPVPDRSRTDDALIRIIRDRR